MNKRVSEGRTLGQRRFPRVPFSSYAHDMRAQRIRVKRWVALVGNVSGPAFPPDNIGPRNDHPRRVETDPVNDRCPTSRQREAATRAEQGVS